LSGAAGSVAGEARGIGRFFRELAEDVAQTLNVDGANGLS
jgi:hypothetical protein